MSETTPHSAAPRRAEMRQPSHADRALALLREQGAKIFTDGSGEAFVGFTSGRTFLVDSKRFGHYLRHLCKRQGEGLVLNDSAVKVVQAELAADVFEAEPITLHVRVARHGDVVYLDLGDRSHRVVEATRDGWRVVDGAAVPVRFRRPPAMLALPEPVHGGRLDELRQHVCLTDDDGQWTLLAGFLVGAIVLAPRGPYAVLFLHGEQGALKTSTTEMCSELIDPRLGAVRALPTDGEGLAICAEGGYLLAFDNISSIDPATSDALSRLAVTTRRSPSGRSSRPA